MNFPDTIIDITEENNCPMYKLGDEFNVCGTALLMPPDKAVCLILVKDITDLFGTPGLGSKGQFRCSGCTGRVRLEYRRDLSFTLPPPRKSDAELATITGLLNRFEFFRSLEGDQVGEVVRLVRLKKYDAGEMIIRRGSMAGTSTSSLRERWRCWGMTGSALPS
ncbi:hypothetical protein DENIS_4897 [Desulfonema ishimotonii]|uniref:Cyclic nucleotide-binding domain-containing protein n=2 Tax=Desulfonema ishimotonii TaxID=45657 RepID=A0A401G3S9_9BACT|nr:hypothetical protein DENIS_4897 [Desulfonema ishimotonii]